MAIAPSKGRYRAAAELAWKTLEERDIRVIASDSGSRISGHRLVLPYFEKRLMVDVGQKAISLDGKAIDDITSILALHYLSGCGQEGPTGQLVAFNQAEGGESYYQAFRSRSIDRLAGAFGKDPARLVRAGARMHGRDLKMGTFAVEVHVFPKLVITAIVWEGDEEIPAAANILFDSSAFRILPTEDLAVAGSLVVARLIKAKD